MSDADREFFKTLGTNAAALIIGGVAVAGAILFGVLHTLALEAMLCGTYLAVWVMLRMTTRTARRTAAASGNDDSEA